MRQCYEQRTNHKGSRRMLATTLAMVLFFLALMFQPVLSQDTDQRVTESVGDLFTSCPGDSSLLIREAKFDEVTMRLRCNRICQSSSPALECHYSDQTRECTARFSLQALSRVYSAVEAANKTAWKEIVDEIDRRGNYKIVYLCVKARGLDPCSRAVREPRSTVAIFPLRVPRARGQHCKMLCDVTLEHISEPTAPLEWEHQFVLRDRPSVEGNHALYQIVVSKGDIQQQWTRFRPSLLTSEVVARKRTNVEKLRLRFRFQNVSDVLRFWLDFPHTTVNVVCGRDETRTTMTPSSTVITTHSPAATINHTITAGTIVYLFVVPFLVLHVLLFVVLIIFMSKRRGNQRLTGEESSLLMTKLRRSSV